MSEKLFEEGFEHSNYDYTLLNTHYEARENKIIEWNKHSSNAEYFINDLESIAELLNIKQMKLEGKEKYNVKISELLTTVEKLNEENEQLKKENKELQRERNFCKAKYLKVCEELYCKDRKLEELGVPIECCDEDE